MKTPKEITLCFFVLSSNLDDDGDKEDVLIQGIPLQDVSIYSNKYEQTTQPYRSEVVVVVHVVINTKKGSRGIASFIFHLDTRCR